MPQLKQLISSSTGPKSLQLGSDDAMMVISRAQFSKQLEEEIVRREQELLSGIEPKQIAGIAHTQRGAINQDTQTVSRLPATLMQDQ